MKIKVCSNILLSSWLLFCSSASHSFALAPKSISVVHQGPRFKDFKATKPLFDLPLPVQEAYERILPQGEYVVFDLEFTTDDASQAKPIEIAALKFRGTKLLGIFYTLVNPEEPLSQKTKGITRLSDSLFKKAPSVSKALEPFMTFIKGSSTLVGHNLLKVDLPMLERLTRDLPQPFQRKNFIIRDTQGMARDMVPHFYLRPQSLENLSHRFNAKIKPNHCAYFDAAATAFIFRDLSFLSNIKKDPIDFNSQNSVKNFGETLKRLLKFAQNYFEPYKKEFVRSYIAPESKLIAFFGNDKLYAEKIQSMAWSYFYGGKKLLFFMKDLEKDIAAMVNQYRQKDQPPIPSRFLKIEKIDQVLEKRLDRLASILKEEGLSDGEITVIGPPLQTRRFLLQVETYQKNGIFPREMSFYYFPAEYIGIESLMEKTISTGAQKTLLWHASDVLMELERMGGPLSETIKKDFESLRHLLVPNLSDYFLSLETSI